MQLTLAKPAAIERSGRRARRFGGVVLTLAALPVALLLLAELALRVFGPIVPGNYETLDMMVADPVFGRFHSRGVSGWIRLGDEHVFMRLNGDGLRGPEWPLARPPGTFRILVLGDAFVEGPSADEAETWVGRLEAALNSRGGPLRFEAINAGVSGWGTAEQSLWLSERGLRYQPDLVIAQFYLGNDVSDNGCRLLGQDKLRHKVCFLPDAARGLRQLELKPREVDTWEPLRVAARRHSAVWNAYETGLAEYVASTKGDLELSSVWKTNMRIFEVNQKSRNLWDEAWQVSEALLARMRDASQSGGARFMVVAAPSVYQVNREAWQTALARNGLSADGWDLDGPNARLGQMVGRLGVASVDLLPSFRQQPDSERLYLNADRHFSSRGHALVAARVEQELRAQGLAP